LTNSKNDLTGVSTATNTYSTKLTGNDKFICSIYLDINNNEIYAESGTLSHKNSFNYLDISDSDKSDIDSAASGINNAGGLPWFVNGGYIMTWDGDHSFKKVAKVDSGLTSISTGSSTKMIAYDSGKEVYGVINIPKAATTTATGATTGTGTTAATTGASVTVSTTAQAGWTKNKDNTWCYLENGTKKTGWLKDGGAWYYLKSDGIMATGWVNDNGTWYYLNSSGAMKTGWVNDNGTWYYLNASGAMLADTTVDGYTLGSDGAWIG
jgi:hypothetical protein